MTDFDTLCRLHCRLTLDTAKAFTGDIIVGVTPTRAGTRWHQDHGRYLHLWSTLTRDGIDIPKLLKQRYGYITEDEIPEDPPTNQPRSLSAAKAQTHRVKTALAAMDD